MLSRAARQIGASSLRDRVIRASAPVAAFVVVGALVVVGSRAAFTATTDNPANNWSAGTVVLADDDTGSAMFNATNLKPGSSVQHCITVTYSGSLAASVKLYATTSGALAQYLNTTIDYGTGGSFGSCAGFSSSSTLYGAGGTSTLQTFGATYTNWATGLATTWSPAGAPPNTSVTFRFTTVLDAATPNSAQGGSASATFTWEAQNT